MEMQYSPTTRGFYDQASTSRPGDCVTVTAAAYSALMNAQSVGQMIQVGEDGQPMVVDVVQSLDELIAAKQAAIQAEKCRIRDAGFDVDGVHYDSDQAARLAYMEFALSLAQDASYTQAAWKASKGVWVTMNATLFGKVKAAGEAALSAAFAWQKARDAEVATIKAAVEAGTMSDADARTALAAVSTTCEAETTASTTEATS